eukprot:403365169
MSIYKPKIPIKSQGAQKYQELASIDEQIQSMTCVPDFGYKQDTIEFKDMSGWKLFYDCIQKEPKYQKLTNYIKERTKETQERLKLQKKKKSKQSLMEELNPRNNEIMKNSKASKELEQLITIHQNQQQFLDNFKTKHNIHRNKTANHNSTTKISSLQEHKIDKNADRDVEILLDDKQHKQDIKYNSNQTNKDEQSLLRTLKQYEKETSIKLQELLNQNINGVDYERHNREVFKTRQIKLQLSILLRLIRQQEYTKLVEELNKSDLLKSIIRDFEDFKLKTIKFIEQQNEEPSNRNNFNNRLSSNQVIQIKLKRAQIQKLLEIKDNYQKLWDQLSKQP